MLEFCDEERCAVAHGFDTTAYAEADEVVWMAAEVESKLEAGRALTELWLDRLDNVALACGFERVRFWLVSREGFSADAAELLNERGAFGSCSEQLDLLSARIGHAGAGGAGVVLVEEVAMELPMGEGTGVVAAHPVEA